MECEKGVNWGVNERSGEGTGEESGCGEYEKKEEFE